MPVSDKLRRTRLPAAAFLALSQVSLLHFVPRLAKGGRRGELELGIYRLPWPMALKQNDYSSHFLLNDFGTSPYPAL